jgi:DNA-directed RNA polymerase subunit beta'
MREVVEEATGLTNKVVTDFRQQSRGAKLSRVWYWSMKMVVTKLTSGTEARYFLSPDTIPDR